MNKYNPKLLQDKRKQTSDDGSANKKKKIDYFFSTQVKEEKMLASQSSQVISPQYSTFASAITVLRQLKHYILDPDLFNYHTKTLSKTKQSFFDMYGSMSFFGSVTGKLDVCQKLLVEQLNAQFNAMDLSVLWSSLLDPQFGLTSKHWNCEKEKEFAKKRLIEEVINLAWKKIQRSLKCTCLSQKNLVWMKIFLLISLVVR
jgi:hypothetical protein